MLLLFSCLSLVISVFRTRVGGNSANQSIIENRLKDEFGGRVVRVKGHAKVMCHLMFGILALTSNQMMCFLE